MNSVALADALSNVAEHGAIESLLSKLRTIEVEIASERGGLVLFGLFELEVMLGQWDLVISAPWVSEDERQVLDYVGGKLRARLSLEEFRLIARIMLLSPDEGFVLRINRAFRVEHGRAEIVNCRFNNVDIDHAFIITSNRGSAPAEARDVERTSVVAGGP